MKQYLLSIYQPDGPVLPGDSLERVMREVHQLRREMEVAGAWVFSAGLFPPETATVVRRRGEELLMTDGPFVEGKEHLGGLTVVRAADLDAAIEWGRRLVETTTLPVEIRPLRTPGEA